MSEQTTAASGTAELPVSARIRRTLDWDIDAQPKVTSDFDPSILTVSDLKMHFPVTSGLLKRQVASVKAVDGVSFSIQKGKTLGIVGESGSGKSTLGNCVMRNLNLTGGSILFAGHDISTMPKNGLRRLRKDMTMITQDPFASLNPRMTVRQSILEGVQLHKLARPGSEQEDLVQRMMMLVGLNPSFAARYPHEFSGGQRQRISIARALALSPSFLVCDEIVSALDVSIQAQIVGLMMKLQETLGLTYMFIGHDLSVVRHLSNHVAVMYLGKFVEYTDSDELYSHPLHPYTQALISAAPIPSPRLDRTRTRILLEGEPPSPIHPPEGCHFCTRCRYAAKRCFTEEPAMRRVGEGHYVACHSVADHS